jgi:predicted  nucleic acid-binding Zn-ribbon protein
MKRCARCGGQLFPDDEPMMLVCLQCGYRPAAVVPLDIPAREPPKRYKGRENGPRIGMMKL